MEDFIWRIPARLVAYVELGMSILWSILVLLRVFEVVNATKAGAILDEKDELLTGQSFSPFRRNLVENLWWEWAGAGRLTLFTGLQWWASLKLRSATKLGGNVYEAWGKAHIWRNVSLAFVAYEVVGIAVDFLSEGYAFWYQLRNYMLGGNEYLLWRGGLLLIVLNYMVELGTVLLSVRVGGAQAG